MSANRVWVIKRLCGHLLQAIRTQLATPTNQELAFGVAMAALEEIKARLQRTGGNPTDARRLLIEAVELCDSVAPWAEDAARAAGS